MTFVEKHRLGAGRTEHEWLKMSWEGEIFGVGMFEEMAEMYPESADEATACATMEWFNIHRCEDFGHAAGVHVSLEDAEKLGREGPRLVRKHTFETVAKMTVAETPAADKMYQQLGKRAGKRGMGIGVALGLVAAIRTGGLSLVGGVLGGAGGGAAIGEFFHKGLKMTDEDTARIGRELDAGHAAVGVLTWDSETEAVLEKLEGLGGTLRSMRWPS